MRDTRSGVYLRWIRWQDDVVEQNVGPIKQFKHTPERCCVYGGRGVEKP